jgi:protoheme IX farnesyltransferase
LFWTILGTGLVAAGASAFNQLLEISRDARMARTRNRPLPSGQMPRGQALAFALVATLAGLEVLTTFVNPLTALLGLLNLIVYLAIYTPLKPRTSLNTLVGGICGAVPPMMGWTAATGELALGAFLLGAILFVWQIPHFLALAWLYRDEYSKAGYRMLPVIDPTGQLTCLLIILYSLTLLPLGLAVMFWGISGYLYGAASLVLGLAFFALGLNLRLRKTAPAARRVFLASVLYLPLLLGTMVADARAHAPQSAAPLPAWPAKTP